MLLFFNLINIKALKAQHPSTSSMSNQLHITAKVSSHTFAEGGDFGEVLSTGRQQTRLQYQLT